MLTNSDIKNNTDPVSNNYLPSTPSNIYNIDGNNNCNTVQQQNNTPRRCVFKDISNRYGENSNPTIYNKIMNDIQHDSPDTKTNGSPTTTLMSDESFHHFNELCSTSIMSGHSNVPTTVGSVMTNSTSLSFDDTVSVGKCKRPRKARSIFSVEQLKILNDEFERHNYINNYTREELANRAGITPEQVKIWFQNMRSKRRKCNDRVRQHCMGFEYNSHPYGDVTHLTQPSLSAAYLQPHYYAINNNNNHIPYINNFATNNTNNGGCTSNNGGVQRIGINHTNNSNINSVNDRFSTNNNCWNPTVKNVPQKFDKSNLFLPQSLNQASNNINIPPPYTYNLQHVTNYQIKDGTPNTFNSSRCMNDSTPTTSNQIQSTQNTTSVNGNNKGVSFIAPGLATTLYNAKINGNDGKQTASINNIPSVQTVITKQNKNVPPPATTFMFNRQSNSRCDNQNCQLSQQYTTSTPHRSNSTQISPHDTNNFCNSSLPPFFNQNPTIYSFKTQNTATQEQHVHSSNTNNIPQNH